MMNRKPIHVPPDSWRSEHLKKIQPILSAEASVLFFFLLYAAVSLPIALITRQMISLMMIWNCFLALLPLIFAWQFRPPSAGSWRYNLPFGFLWLLFFPNSPYMVTDFIHLSTFTFFSPQAGGIPAVQAVNPASWLSLIQIGTGVLFGSLSGMLSMSLVHSRLIDRWGSKAANLFVILICLISGYAIFIGRFLRFNSWDVVHPLRLMAQLTAHVNLASAGSSLLFAVYILLSYWLFRMFTELSDPRSTRFRS